MKYKMALDERPTAATAEHNREHMMRTSSRQSDAAYTLRAPSMNRPRSRNEQDSQASKSFKRPEKKAQLSLLDCKHACAHCCPSCSALKSGTQMITLAISSPTKCNCEEKRRQMATPSAKSNHQKEKELSRTGTFGPGQRVASPPSQKSSIAPSNHSAQKDKEPVIYNLIHSQNKMIRQITSELTKQRDITQEIEKGLRNWKEDIYHMKSEDKRRDSPEVEIRNEREIERFSVEDRPRSRLSVSQHSRSERSIQNQFEQVNPNMDSVRQRSVASVDKFRTASFRKSTMPEQSVEAMRQRPRCNSTDSHVRKSTARRIPNSGSSELIKDQTHHQRCCLGGSKKKTKKPKVATPHIYQLSYCGSACKQPSLPFNNLAIRQRPSHTRKAKPEPRYMYPVHRQPGAVIDALADIVARRLKVELKP